MLPGIRSLEEPMLVLEGWIVVGVFAGQNAMYSIFWRLDLCWWLMRGYRNCPFEKGYQEKREGKSRSSGSLKSVVDSQIDCHEQTASLPPWDAW